MRCQFALLRFGYSVVPLAFLAPAQDTRGKVQGLVSDPSSAVVAGATVTLRNENTGVQAHKVTDEYGK